MRKVAALILSVLIVLVAYSQVTLFTIDDAGEERETVIISRVIDGDTVELSDGRTLRLVNINSPEKSTIWSKQATDFLNQYNNATVEIEALDTDKYGRTLARIYAPTYLNAEIVQRGLASKFLVQEDELEAFAKSEQQAIENEEGIWIHSSYYGCFDIDVRAKDEEVLIHNACDDISMLGFILKDESRKLYKFGDISHQDLLIRSGVGNNSGNELFWQSSTSIWNDDRDAAYLFDSEGKLAGYHSYGY